ncbi:MAG TPA: hypothetical protein DCZ40_09085 [Lachnospiraceae bacterium]|nr:hypothetical protein [Lachnospiraceae bacterium]
MDNEGKMDENNKVIGGYCFGTAEDAEIARQEVKKIEYLEQHMDYKKTENMLLVYKKAIESRVFVTPIGWEYLKKLQNELLGREDLKEEIPPVALYTVFAHRVGDDIKVPAPRIPEKGRDNTKKNFIVSVIINVVLAVAVSVMFYIAYTSENPNVLNYKRNLVDKYAQWEQELTERENAVREKERNLMIEE